MLHSSPKIKSGYYHDFFSKKSGYCQSVNLNVLLVNGRGLINFNF